jgi:hypothetical protein
MRFKFIAIMLVIFAASLGLGWLSMRHYNNYQARQQVVKSESAVTISQLQSALIDAQNTTKSFSAEYNKLHAECQKGLDFYNTQPPATKANKVAPNCGQPLIQ